MNKKEIKKLLVKAMNLIQDAEMELDDNERIKDSSWISCDINRIRVDLINLLESEFKKC